MKKIIFGLTLAAGLTLTSCSDFLNEPILGQQDMENYFATEEECANQVVGCYAYLACDDWWQIYKHYGLVDMCTDDEWMGNTTQEPGDYKPLSHYTGNTIEGGNAVQNFYQYRWKGILQCNIAIMKIPELTFNDDSYQKRLIGEAKFLRAFMYFDLARNFGGLPIIEGLKMPSESQGIERATLSETYAFIEQDLKDAIEALPVRSAYAAADMGRATKGAAQGLLGRYISIRRSTTRQRLSSMLLSIVVSTSCLTTLVRFGAWTTTIVRKDSLSSRLMTTAAMV